MTRANPDFEMAQRHLKEADMGQMSGIRSRAQDVTLNLALNPTCELSSLLPLEPFLIRRRRLAESWVTPLAIVP